MGAIDDCETHAPVVSRLGVKVRTQELTIPGPVILGVGSRVNSDKTMASANEILEGGLLGGVEDIASGI